MVTVHKFQSESSNPDIRKMAIWGKDLARIGADCHIPCMASYSCSVRHSIFAAAQGGSATAV